MIAAVLVTVSISAAEDRNVFLREEFETLDAWRPLFFPKIRQHSRYSVVKEGDASVLKAESSASASGIIFRKEFNVYDFPKARWRWKIVNIYRKANGRTKGGDDYPIRIYVIFRYEPEKASFGKRLKYGLAKTLYGEYPPESSLNYVWASRQEKERIFTNPYADEAKMVVLRSGGRDAGRWIEEEVDILADYRAAFGTDPPAAASIAIMNDSDNTGESSVSYVDYIEVYR